MDIKKLFTNMLLTFFSYNTLKDEAVCLIFMLLVPIKGEDDFLGDDDPRVLGLGLIAWSSIAMPCHPTAPPAAPKTSTPHPPLPFSLLLSLSLSLERAQEHARGLPPNPHLIAREWSNTSTSIIINWCLWEVVVVVVILVWRER